MLVADINLLCASKKINMKDKVIDINYSMIQSYVIGKRPSVEIRDRLDYGFKYEKNAYEIFEVRPVWNSQDPSDYQKLSFVRIRYIKTKRIWKLYWMRGSGKWELYKPFPESTSLDKLLTTIDEDSFGCFYG